LEKQVDLQERTAIAKERQVQCQEKLTAAVCRIQEYLE
jgi:hypothetical protein